MDHQHVSAKKQADDDLNDALEDTFPASDPLPLSPGTGVGSPRRRQDVSTPPPASKMKAMTMDHTDSNGAQPHTAAPPTSVEKIASLVAGGMMSLWALRQGGLLGTLGVLAAGALLARGMAEMEGDEKQLAPPH